MRFGYKFSNLCGTLYVNGNLTFTPDGNSLISPVGNRLTVFDLVNQKSTTLPFQARKDINRVALSPDGSSLITIDEDGHALLVNFRSAVVLNHFNFKTKVDDLKFSADGAYFVVTHGKQVQAWKAPGQQREYAPFQLHRVYTGHDDDVLSLDWSPDNRFFMTGSADNSCKIYSLDPVEGWLPVTLSGHRDAVIACGFCNNGETAFSIARDGALYSWKWTRNQGEDQEERGIAAGLWSLDSKFYFKQQRVVDAALHRKSNILVVGFETGTFGLYELPSCTNLHTLSISSQRITAVSINPSADWLAFGCAELGQLLVWEWQSETYVLKQQGHALGMNCLTYSPDGALVATGGEDAKVKLWNTTTGFCFVTFTEHEGPVQAIEFVPSGNAIVSASLDGSVRAYDTIRYRNFRTLTTPKAAQFSSVAVDPSGEIVAAGTVDSFEIYVWSLQAGRLLEVLAGHEAPLSALAFHPTEPTLASCSWDHTVKLWDVYKQTTATDSFEHASDVLALAFRPDGGELVCGTLDGQLHLWNLKEGVERAVIHGRRDVAAGRSKGDKMTAANSASGKCFTSVCYSADGSVILAGGSSKFVCIYDSTRRSLIKRFELTTSMSVDGVRDKLSTRRLTEAGSLDDLDLETSDRRVAGASRPDVSLPGAKRGALAMRTKTPITMKAKGVRFSPTGRAWAAATPLGLQIYSLDAEGAFDPFDLSIDLTPDAVLAALAEGDWGRSLLMSVRLNEVGLVGQVYQSIPLADISLVVQQLPSSYIGKIIDFIATHVDRTPHLSLHLAWATAVLNTHGTEIRSSRGELLPSLRSLLKSLLRHQNDLGTLCENNTYTMRYLTTAAAIPRDDSPMNGAGGAM